MAACGAKTRAGKPCQAPGMDNGRCRMHGGPTPKGQINALKHGIYAKSLRSEELELWHQIELGSVDDELRLLRIQLYRATIAQRELEDADRRQAAAAKAFLDTSSGMVDRPAPAEDEDGDEEAELAAAFGTMLHPRGTAPEGFELTELKDDPDGRSITHSRPDFRVVIDRLAGRIAQLEKVRLELISKTGGKSADEIARDIKAILDAIEENVTGGAGEASDDSDADPDADPDAEVDAA